MKEVVTLHTIMMQLKKLKYDRVVVKSFVQGVKLNPHTQNPGTCPQWH
jgi:hypothetical protein